MTTKMLCCRWVILIAAFFPILSHLSPCQEEPGASPLIEAIWQEDLPKARRLLVFGAKLNVRDNYGATPLIAAITRRFSGFAEELVLAGADPNFTGGANDSPLMLAAWECDVRVAKFLVGRGAVINAVDQDGTTPLMSASQTCSEGEMVEFLIKAGANVNSKSKVGDTALITAAFSGNNLAIKQLLAKGADIWARGAENQTATSVACNRVFGRTKSHDEACSLLRTAEKTSSSEGKQSRQ